MRKRIILTILLILLSINIKEVAASCEDIKMYASNDNFWEETHSVYFSFDGNKYLHYGYGTYKFKNQTGVTFSSYCRQAGYSAGKVLGKNTNFICDYQVFKPNSSNESLKRYEAGIIAILENGYSSINNSNPVYVSTKDQFYAATTVALRAFEMLISPEYKDHNAPANNAHKYYAYTWLNEYQNRIINLTNNSLANLQNRVKGYITGYWTDGTNNYVNITDKIVKEAKRLFEIGLQRAEYYKQNGAASLKVNYKTQNKELITTDAWGIKTYKTNVIYNIKAENFKSNRAKINVNFVCDNCDKLGVSYTIKANDTVITDIENIDLTRFLTNGAANIDLKIEFVGTSAKYDCSELKYTLDVLYFDDTISVEAYNLHSAECPAGTICQDFYMLYAVDQVQEESLEGKIQLCGGAELDNCTNLKELCNNGNEDACEKYAEECDENNNKQCSAIVTNAECSSNDSDIYIKEGYEKLNNTCNISDKANILDCVIGKSDIAGNSYEDKSMSANKYCSVYCKEDYHLVLPGIKEANSGRYFTLKTSISGTKTCYTTKINESSFEKDFDEAIDDVITAYNDYSYYYEAVNDATCTKEEKPGAKGTIVITSNTVKQRLKDYIVKDYYKECLENNAGNNNVNTICNSDKNKYDIELPNYTSVQCNWSYDRYVGNTRYTRNATYQDGKSECSNQDNCVSVDGIDTSAKYKSILNQKSNTLSNKIRTVNNTVSEYNSCSNWTMDYNFDPEISFWYEENYMNSVKTNLLNTIGNVEKDRVNISRCATNTDDTYEECNTGWTSNSLKETVTKFSCFKSGSTYTCGRTNFEISKAVRVKASIEAKASYITPTQFYTIYPSGAIAVASSGADIENGNALNNQLPIGLGTKQGVYNYTLQIDNLGEYYDKEGLGRIWGAKNSVVVNTLDEDNECRNPGDLKDEVSINNKYFDDGVYVCSYKVNCPDCPVECEENGCFNPSCPDNSCPVTCDKCIYTNNNSNVSFRPITNENVNPNDRELGENWEFDEDNIKSSLELKAYVTTKEIIENGDTIYDIYYEEDESNNYALKVTLDSKTISRVREYNNKYKDEGGYLNNTLKCYNHSNPNDGKTYENIYCYSTFIDEMLYDGFKENFEFIGGERLIGDNREETDNLRKLKTQLSGYWTTWSMAKPYINKWIITESIGFDYNTNYPNIGIGPSWK